MAESGAPVAIVGNYESCPECGELTRSPEGMFQLGDELMKALSQPRVTRESIQTFRDTAQAVAAGSRNADDAAKALEEVDPLFAQILRWTNLNSGALTVLVAILGVIVACFGVMAQREGSDLAHSDAQEQLKVARQQSQTSTVSDQERRKAEADLRKLQSDVARLNALVGDGDRIRR